MAAVSRDQASTIASGLVFCEGYQSCGASIQSTKTVECTAFEACHDTLDMSAERLFCDGFKSCAETGEYVIAGDMSCSGSLAWCVVCASL